MTKSDNGGEDDKNWPHPTTARSMERQRSYVRSFVKNYRTEVAASAASLGSTIVAYPLDVVKTRMQTYYFRNFWSCIVYTYKRDGLPGFWRGVIAPLCSITLVRTVSFSIYQHAKYNIDDVFYRATGHSPIEHANTKGALPSASTIACFGAAGATSGALATLVSCPFELAKVYSQIFTLMAQTAKNKSGGPLLGPRNLPLPPPLLEPGEIIPKGPSTPEVFRTLWKKGGARGLYTGFGLHVVRDTIGSAIYFVTYESSKQLMANARGDEPSSPLAVVVAGGLCGLLSWTCIYPIDSAKSIYQQQVLSSRPGTVVKAVKIEFFNRARYRGLPVSVIRSCCLNAIFFTVFERVKKRINQMEDDDE